MNSRRSNLFPIYKLSLPVYIRATAQESSRETKDLSCATQLRTIGGLAASRIAKDEPDSKVEYVYPLSLSLSFSTSTCGAHHVINGGMGN